MSSRKELKEQARQARLAREAELAAAAARRKRLLTMGGAAAVVVVVVVAVIAVAGGGGGASPSKKAGTQGSTPQLKVSSLASLGTLQSPGSPGLLGPEGVPIPAAPELASASSTASGGNIDNIGCLGQEQTVFHIHAHLTLFVNGTPRQIPAAIGITNPQVQNTAEGAFAGGGTNSCFYWLHTHASDGIVHIESPTQRTYTVGNFFDIWGQPLGPSQVGPAKGSVTALYDGKLYEGNPRDIPLNAHAQIQLDVGKPLVAPVTIAFPATL
ncbi:MAG TPA: hypothetical protein VG294_16955 [Solirubrobacteraceae bacterium]|nr:hypothetical protein [Solirubrobacteraceae bacterium]